MTRPIKDLAKSVHIRLLNLAKENGRPFNEVLQLFAMERFLYLSLSTLWGSEPNDIWAAGYSVFAHLGL